MLSPKGRAIMTWMEQDLKNTREDLWHVEFKLFKAIAEGANPNAIKFLERMTAVWRVQLLNKSRHWNASFTGILPLPAAFPWWNASVAKPSPLAEGSPWWNAAETPRSPQRPAWWDDSSD